MSVSVMRCFEYAVVCDWCGAMETYHTGDHDHGVYIHTIRSALKASKYKQSRKHNSMLLCPECQRLLDDAVSKISPSGRKFILDTQGKG